MLFRRQVRGGGGGGGGGGSDPTPLGNEFGVWEEGDCCCDSWLQAVAIRTWCPDPTPLRNKLWLHATSEFEKA